MSPPVKEEDGPNVEFVFLFFGPCNEYGVISDLRILLIAFSTAYGRGHSRLQVATLCEKYPPPLDLPTADLYQRECAFSFCSHFLIHSLPSNIMIRSSTLKFNETSTE